MPAEHHGGPGQRGPTMAEQRSVEQRRLTTQFLLNMRLRAVLDERKLTHLMPPGCGFGDNYCRFALDTRNRAQQLQLEVTGKSLSPGAGNVFPEPKDGFDIDLCVDRIIARGVADHAKEQEIRAQSNEIKRRQDELARVKQSLGFVPYAAIGNAGTKNGRDEYTLSVTGLSEAEVHELHGHWKAMLARRTP